MKEKMTIVVLLGILLSVIAITLTTMNFLGVEPTVETSLMSIEPLLDETQNASGLKGLFEIRPINFKTGIQFSTGIQVFPTPRTYSSHFVNSTFVTYLYSWQFEPYSRDLIPQKEFTLSIDVRIHTEDYRGETVELKWLNQNHTVLFPQRAKVSPEIASAFSGLEPYSHYQILSMVGIKNFGQSMDVLLKVLVKPEGLNETRTDSRIVHLNNTEGNNVKLPYESGYASDVQVEYFHFSFTGYISYLGSQPCQVWLLNPETNEVISYYEYT